MHIMYQQRGLVLSVSDGGESHFSAYRGSTAEAYAEQLLNSTCHSSRLDWHERLANKNLNF